MVRTLVFSFYDPHSGYHADLMFLQEVDFRLHRRFLTPFLTSKGYIPRFLCKANEAQELFLIANKRLI